MPAILEQALRTLGAAAAEPRVSNPGHTVNTYSPTAQAFAGYVPALCRALRWRPGALLGLCSLGRFGRRPARRHAGLDHTGAEQSPRNPGCAPGAAPRTHCTASLAHRSLRLQRTGRAGVFPVPQTDIADEAAWRLIAHVAQTPFTKNCVSSSNWVTPSFSGLRQCHGQTGLLFGVQSPHASTSEIFEHIRTFIRALRVNDSTR